MKIDWGKIKSAQYLAIISLVSLSSCAFTGSIADQLNPYDPGKTATSELGERSNAALTAGGGGGGKEAESARHALEVMGSYKRTSYPQPYYPVVRPAEVRLMWVPDHLNRHGDLVPAHYYYLRVLNDGWELQDAFEVEQQLKAGSGEINYSGGGGGASQNFGTSGSGGSTPWVYKETR